MVPTMENVEELWGKVRDRRILFPDASCTKAGFMKAMLNSCILTSGPGLLRVSNIVPFTRCEIHGFVLNGAATPFREILLECLTWIFRRLKVKRVECFIPSSARSLRRFLESCGFEHEGHLRNRLSYMGKICSEEVYAILQEDML